MLKFIQKWLHNNILKKYGFGWLYRDFFYISEYFCVFSVCIFIKNHKKLKVHVKA